MARKPTDTESRGIDPDEVIENIDASTGSRAVVGFIGKSTRSGFVRLYISPAFNNYFEISRSDILKTRDIDLAVSPLGGTVVYLKCSAKVTQFKMRAFEVEAEYLEGRIAAQVALTARRCDPKEPPCDEPDPAVLAPAGTSVFACGGTSWFLAAPDLPNPWTTSDCNSSTFGNQCTWTAEC